MEAQMSTFPEHDLGIGAPVERAKDVDADELRRARLTVASNALGPYDCARLLDMLSLVDGGQIREGYRPA